MNGIASHLLRLLFVLVLATSATVAATETESTVTIFDSAAQMAAITDRRAELERSLHSLSSTQTMLGRYATEPSVDVVRSVEQFSEAAAVTYGTLEESLAAARALYSAVDTAHTELGNYVRTANAPAASAQAQLPALERACADAEQALVSALAEHGDSAPQSLAAHTSWLRSCDEYDAAFDDAAVLFDPSLLNDMQALRDEAAALVAGLEHEMVYSGRQVERARRRISLVVTENAVRDAVASMRVDSAALQSALRDTSSRIRGLVEGLGNLPDLGPRMQQMPTRPHRARTIADFVRERGEI